MMLTQEFRGSSHMKLLSELSKCCLNHQSARAKGKCNQAFKRLQDEQLHFIHTVSLA